MTIPLKARFVDQGVAGNIYIRKEAVEHAHAEGVLAATESAMNKVDEG